MNIPDAPPALAPLLRRLLVEAHVEVTQHHYHPHPDAWYVGLVLPGPGGGVIGGGDLGPFASAKDAIVRLVAWLVARHDEARAELAAAEAEARQMGAELAEVRAAARLAAQVADELATRLDRQGGPAR